MFFCWMAACQFPDCKKEEQNMNDKKYSAKKKLWIVCYISVVIISAIGLSPLVVPNYVFEPKLFGAPYSLWMGFVLTSLLVVLTFLGSRVHPGEDNSKHD